MTVDFLGLEGPRRPCINDDAPFPGLEGVIKQSKMIQGPPKAQDLLSVCALGIRKK